MGLFAMLEDSGARSSFATRRGWLISAGGSDCRNRFKAVLFDVDGTLYRQGPMRLAMARNWPAHRWCSGVGGAA
jgi:hypothetical protein